LFIPIHQTGYGQAAEVPAAWRQESAKKILTVNVLKQLSPDHKEMLNSGFSTFTILKLGSADLNQPLVVKACSLKYDTWDETYQFTDFSSSENYGIQKNLDLYAAKCLEIDLESLDLQNEILKATKPWIELQIHQASPNEGAKVKEWLVKQQSALMKGLYGHMLGDLTFTNKLLFAIRVPRD
jgi:hypothetical protein